MAQVKPLVHSSGDIAVIPTGDTLDPAILGTGTRDGTKFLRDDGTYQAVAGGSQDRVIGVTIDGGSSVVTTGIKGYIVAGFTGTINGWDVVADAAGSIVIDVWKVAAGSVPTVANTITGSEKPTLSSQQINSDVTLTTWTTSVVKGEVLGFNVDSASVVKKVTLTLRLTA